MTTETRYNGWTNYETWAVKLWIDNEERSYNYWRATTEDLWAQSGDFPDPQQLSQSAHARYLLAEQLKDEFTEAMPQLDGMWSDLLSAALSEVDWVEIADNMLSDTEGYEAA